MGLPNLEATFETLVEAFVFLDKNKDGYVSKNEMVDAINETTAGEHSSRCIAMRRFGQCFLVISVHMHICMSTCTSTSISTHFFMTFIYLNSCTNCFNF